MTRSPCSHSDGFTLIELLVGIVVFSLGILALIRLQVSSLEGNSFANDLTQAVVLAEDRMERLMALPYDHDDLRDADNDGTGQDGNQDGVDDNGEDFGLSDTVSGGTVIADRSLPSGRYLIYWNTAVDQPLGRSKTVRVIVTWQDKRSILHRTVLSSVKSDSI
ncbi:MAG: prepilin-type N-terminal cleavage/methylation domain-containing protein [Syntrophobacteraceae bacterium]|jgi:type IV pilus assembly protein PilV|nr:prepilin-type N-terminal cleavage/methylation domain-containing protein [Syntrophobacteraceae bacterium]